MMLLIDIGNTRIKWATYDSAGLSVQQAACYAGWGVDQFTREVLSFASRPERVLVSNVGGTAIGGIVRDAIEQHWGLTPELVVSTAAACGVRNAYPVPANLGADRWLAVIAAHARARRLHCIVSVGTAMTIDGVDASGQHLGGVIVPGPGLMVGSLLRNTSDIAQRAQQGLATDALFADNTLGAIHQGSVHALAALVERAVETLRQQEGTAPVVLLTGGAAPVVERALRIEYEVVADLVLQGLVQYTSAAG